MSAQLEVKSIQPTPYTISLFPSGIKIPAYILEQSADTSSRMLTDTEIDNVTDDTHYQASRRFIKDSAAGLTGSAAILGIGNASDIPLQELATQFDSLTLVELDREAVVNAVRRLPLSLQSKCHIIVDDLGGSIAETVQLINEALRACRNSTTFAQRVAEDLPFVTHQALDFGSNFDYIVSSLVTSQLHMAATAHTVYSSIAHYGPINIQKESPYFSKQMKMLGKRLREDHFKMIGQKLKPAGRLYWSDTMSYSAVDMNSNGILVPSSDTLIDLDHLNMCTENFSIDEQREWIWSRKNSSTLETITNYPVLARNMSLAANI